LCPFFIEFLDKKAGTVAELLILWIENLLIPYPIRGVQGTGGKVAVSPVGVREDGPGKDHSACE
jgi:hypothetical protein